MNKIIYLIRHGQTDFNLRGIVQGGTVDTDLNAKGMEQANRFFQHYKNIAFDKIYTSGLKRTVQTAQQFIDNGVPFESMKALNEISWGKLDGKIANSADNELYAGLINSWTSGDFDAKIDTGESPIEVQTRLKTAFAEIMSKEDEKIILICMHGRAIRILLSTIFDNDLSKMDTYEHQNLCLYLLEFTDNQYSLHKTNDISHMK